MSTNPDTKPRGVVRGIITPGLVRFAFPHLKAPHTGGKFPSNKYEIHALIPKVDTATVTLLREKCLEAVLQIVPGVTPAELTTAIRDGDEKENKEGFKDHWYIRPKSGRAVPVYDGQRAAIAPEMVHGGDYGRLKLSAVFYRDNLDPGIAKDLMAVGRRIIVEKDQKGQTSYFRPAASFYLDAVQLVRSGEPFGGKADGHDFPAEAGDFG